MKKQGLPKVTVALVCHKEGQQLSEVLEDLSRQTAFHQIGEILLFQNAACPATKQTAQSFKTRLNLKISSSTENHLGRARASLVEKAQYKWIAFVDADCRLKTTWLEELLSHWQKAQDGSLIAAIGGPNRLPENRYWKKLVNLSLSHPFGHVYSAQNWQVSKKTKVGHISTTNGLFLKSAVLQAGNFSARYKRTGEDRELGHRLKKQGLLLLFSTPMVINNYAESYGESLKRLFIFGKCEGQNPIDWKTYAGLLFLPIGTLCLIAGFIGGCFWPFFGVLFLPYLLFGGVVACRQKKTKGLLLPALWGLNHSFLSAGILFGFFARIYTMKSTTKSPPDKEGQKGSKIVKN